MVTVYLLQGDKTVLLCSVIISTHRENKLKELGTCHTARKLMPRGYWALEKDREKLSPLVLIPILTPYEPQ